MFPFWEDVVAPVLEAAGARRLVEIGALRGENTRQIIERLGPETELHVIDPLPDFDPVVHEREFGGQYVFHRALSLEVLGTLPPMDAALIDGDHNWYTVYNELELLAGVARAHDAPLPVLVLHDVGWPYGRRDLYYDPDTVPAEFRQDWKRAGMEPGKVRLVPFGAGLNPTLANAKIEGGRRNGVRTGLDDFVAGYGRPLRVVTLPIYFGLAIVIEQERLDANPALAAELDRLESPAGKDRLLELAEELRLGALIFQHKVFYRSEVSIDRLARRYLGQVVDAMVADGAERTRLEEVQDLLDAVRRDHVLGHVVAVGTGDDRPARLAKAHLEAYGLEDRQLWAIVDGEGSADGARLRAGLEALDLADDRFHQISLRDVSPPEAVPGRVALVLLGHWIDGLEELLPVLVERLSYGGHLLVSPGLKLGPAEVAAFGVELEEVGTGGARWRRRAVPRPGSTELLAEGS